MKEANAIYCLSFSPTPNQPQGPVLATASADRRVQIWSASDMHVLAVLQGHTDQVTQVVWSPDGHFLASASLDQTVCIWTCKDAASCAWSCQAVLQGHSGRVTDLRFLPNCQQLVTGSTDHMLRVWCCFSWEWVNILKEHKGIITAIDVLKDGQWAVSASGDGSCCVWDLSSSSLKHKLEADSGGVTCCCFVPHRNHAKCNILATAHYDQQRNQGRVLLWDLQPKGLNWIDGRIAGHFRAFDSFGGRVTALAFTAVDSIGQNTDMLSLVAMACSDGTIRVADLADDDYHYTLSIAAPTSNITFQENAMNNWHHMRHNMLAAVSSCGQWLATVGTSNSMEVQVWDAETGTLVKTCLRSSSPIRVVKWSRTGQATQLIATGNATGKCQVYLWTGCEA